MGTCIWDKAWVGICGKAAGEWRLCAEHRGKKCAGCGDPAIRECAHTGIQFVCGAPICANCTHGMPDPKNPGMFSLGGGHHPKEVVKKQVEDAIERDKEEKANERPKSVDPLVRLREELHKRGFVDYEGDEVDGVLQCLFNLGEELSELDKEHDELEGDVGLLRGQLDGARDLWTLCLNIAAELDLPATVGPDVGHIDLAGCVRVVQELQRRLS